MVGSSKSCDVYHHEEIKENTHLALIQNNDECIWESIGDIREKLKSKENVMHTLGND